MKQQYHFASAFLREGWARHVNVAVSDAGIIESIERGVPSPDALRITGIVIPGMPNGHSHAFQRAMAGTAEYRRGRDSFWTWRQAMYGLANRIDPPALQTIATQLYIEMLKSGYTAVAEFHYLHRHSDGAAYTGDNALWEAIRAAAETAGIGLTLLPTLYQTGDFGGRPLKAEQARFAMDSEAFVRSIDAAVSADRRRGSSLCRTGAAFHSLRAVPETALRDVAAQLRGVDAGMPVHIHVAEQLREVRACRRATGKRPIELLLDSGLVGEHWCLVHCTHATLEEIRGIARAQAAVCVSISTEANLGDGWFDAARFLAAGGRLCIGSDSQSTVNPAEELRWLEYQQRLRRQRRGMLASEAFAHVGTRLWRTTAIDGARALGQPLGSLEVGRRADWLVLDPSHAALAGADPAAVLDHVIFAGADAAIRDVMVGGRWVVRDGRHPAEADARAAYSVLMHRLRDTG